MLALHVIIIIIADIVQHLQQLESDFPPDLEKQRRTNTKTDEENPRKKIAEDQFITKLLSELAKLRQDVEELKESNRRSSRYQCLSNRSERANETEHFTPPENQNLRQRANTAPDSPSSFMPVTSQSLDSNNDRPAVTRYHNRMQQFTPLLYPNPLNLSGTRYSETEESPRQNQGIQVLYHRHHEAQRGNNRFDSTDHSDASSSSVREITRYFEQGINRNANLS